MTSEVFKEAGQPSSGSYIVSGMQFSRPVQAREWAMRWTSPLADKHLPNGTFEERTNLSADIAEHLQHAFDMAKAAPTPPATASGRSFRPGEIFWCLENAVGQWLLDENGAFTLNIHLALRWPSFVLADEVRRNLRQPLYDLRVTEHKTSSMFGTPSSGEAVAVSVEKVEQLISYYAYAVASNQPSLMEERYAHLLAAIRSLAAPQANDGVREDALEEAAKIADRYCSRQAGTLDVPYLIRALKTAQPKIGREDEGSDGWRPEIENCSECGGDQPDGVAL